MLIIITMLFDVMPASPLIICCKRAREQGPLRRFCDLPAAWTENGTLQHHSSTFS